MVCMRMDGWNLVTGLTFSLGLALLEGCGDSGTTTEPLASVTRACRCTNSPRSLRNRWTTINTPACSDSTVASWWPRSPARPLDEAMETFELDPALDTGVHIGSTRRALVHEEAP